MFMECITCKRELSSKKEGLYLKAFKSNWCDLCISSSIHFIIEHTTYWHPERFYDLSFWMKDHFVEALFEGKEATSEEIELKLEEYYGYYLKSYKVIDNYSKKKYGLNYEDFIMKLRKRADSSRDFFYYADSKNELYTREIRKFDREETLKMGSYEDFYNY